MRVCEDQVGQARGWPGLLPGQISGKVRSRPSKRRAGISAAQPLGCYPTRVGASPFCERSPEDPRRRSLFALPARLASRLGVGATHLAIDSTDAALSSTCPARDSTGSAADLSYSAGIATGAGVDSTDSALDSSCEQGGKTRAGDEETLARSRKNDARWEKSMETDGKSGSRRN